MSRYAQLPLSSPICWIDLLEIRGTSPISIKLKSENQFDIECWNSTLIPLFWEKAVASFGFDTCEISC